MVCVRYPDVGLVLCALNALCRTYFQDWAVGKVVANLMIISGVLSLMGLIGLPIADRQV
jgi:hypothetical protein